MKIRFMLKMWRMSLREFFISEHDFLNFSEGSDVRKSGSLMVLSQIAREHQAGTTRYTSTAATIYGGII